MNPQPTLNVTAIVWLVTRERTLAGKPPLQCRVMELRETHGRIYHVRLQPADSTAHGKWHTPTDICRTAATATRRATAILDDAHDALSRQFATGHSALVAARRALGLIE